MKYYLVENDKKQGPFDLLAMIRRIRNGSIQPESTVQIEGEREILRAAEIPKLADVFLEMEQDGGDANTLSFRKHSLSRCLSGGWAFFQANQISTVYAGVLVLGIIVLTAVLHQMTSGFLRVPAYAITYILGFLGLSVYLFLVLRMNRGQAADLGLIMQYLAKHFKTLLIAACCISLASMIGFVLLIIPGLFLLTLYIFTPLLIMDHDLEFWDAMETSRKLVLGGGIDNFGIIFALVVINFIGAIFVFLPLLITLPVTMSALCEIYDELISA